MHYIIYTAVIWGLVYFLVGERFKLIWKVALLGVLLQVAVDYFGTRYNLYLYPRGYVYIGRLPVMQSVNIYGVSLLFFNWLPRSWGKRILYIIYADMLFLAMEALMYSAGGIIFPNWKLHYSYLLNIAGLLLITYLSDFISWRKMPQDTGN